MADEIRSTSNQDSNDAEVADLAASTLAHHGQDESADLSISTSFGVSESLAESSQLQTSAHSSNDALLADMSQSGELIEDSQTFLSRFDKSVKEADSTDPSFDETQTIVEISPEARCQICHDKSSGLHYGVLACEGCKGFFRRALQDVGDPNRRKCYYNKNCEITPSTRNRCQYCRLQKCLLLGMSRGSAKLGRRSRRMRESIAETCKTIEDTQTQALHGLLSLKDDTQATVLSDSTSNNESGSHTVSLVVPSDNSNQLETVIVTSVSAPSSSTSLTPPTTSSQSDAGSSKTRTGIYVNPRPDESEIILEYRLEKARKANNEVYNRNRNRLRNLQNKLREAAERKIGSNQPLGLFKLSQLAGTELNQPGTKLLIVNTDKLPIAGQTFLTTSNGDVIDMSNVQIINPASLNQLTLQNQDKFIISPQEQSINKTGETNTASSSQSHDMYRSPLKKRPYRPSEDAIIVDMSSVKRHTGEDTNQQNIVLVDEMSGAQSTSISQPQAGVSDVQSVNMADVASTVYDAYIETVQFTFNNTMSMRENMHDKFVAPPNITLLDEIQATACWKSYEARFNEAIADVVSFAKRIPGFSALETDDQIILIKGGSFEVACVMQCSFIDPENDYMLLSGTDSAYTREQLRNSFITGPQFVDMLFDFSKGFSAFRLTDVETALFCALMLIRPDRGNLTNKEKVNKLQEILLQALQTQVDENHRAESGLFAKLLMVVSNLRELNSEQRRVLNNLKGQMEFSEGLLAEIFDLTD